MSKIFGKIKRGKIIVALLFVVMVTSLIIAMAGCSDKEKSTFWDDYGKEKAYNTASGSTIRHATSSITYYIDSSVTGNYKTAVTYAINKANKLTDAVTIKYSTSKSKATSGFVIKVANLGANEENAANDHGWTSSGEILSSTITLNSYYMKSYSLKNMKHIALHEIGHTFGLADLYSAAVEPYSVMYYAYSTSSSYTFSDYQEFDKQNISWYYD